ncbi:MAG: hypothetical protein GWN87_11805, partial [Desulfuromonadales bacterium]|nr:hypothetical protein [Desulfuromonadales bacterium]NIS41105.1 hypothetical protein [Desulfuromonadales bacterium]
TPGNEIGSLEQMCGDAGQATGEVRALADLLRDYEDTLLMQAFKEHGTTRKVAAALGLSQATAARKLKVLRERKQMKTY